MDTKDIIKATESTQRLVQNEQYYKYIFKKTEKVVSVVFYIAHTSKTDEKGQKLFEDILATAKEAHDAVLASLEIRTHIAEEAVRNAAHTLMALESKLKVGEMANVITGPVMSLLSAEIDAILRNINKFLPGHSVFESIDEAPIDRERSELKRPKLNEGSGSTAPAKLSRRERIKTVLGAKEGATVKDIGDIISDCSEKTIQRELNSLIEDNLVQRQGERRWSKYFLVK